MVNSTFVSDDEWKDWINSNLCEVYDLLVQAGPPSYYSSTYTFTTTPQVLSYALPADFRSMTCLFSVYASDRRTPIPEINDWDRARCRPPQGAYTVEMEYVPVPPLLENDADTFDGVSGWEELIVAMSARDALMKEESDVSAMMDRIERLKIRIRTASSQRGRGPNYITDVTNASLNWFGSGSQVRLNGCRIRGDNLELFEPNNYYGFY